MLREGKGINPKRNLFHRKRFHTFLITCQTILQDDTEAQTMMGQGWERSHLGLDWDCLDVCILDLLFKL